VKEVKYMNNIDEAVKKLSESITNFVKNNRVNSLKLCEDLRKNQLKGFSTKELMEELRRRGKTVGKKGIK
jgi:uncharacterized protein YoxC